MPKTTGRARWLSRAAAAASVAGALYVSRNWLRYGHPRAPKTPDPLLDRFMPEFEVREYHARRVAAPAEVTFEAALEEDLQASRLVRAIFRAREIAMRGRAAATDQPRALLPTFLSIGWVVLAHEPNRRMVFGAVTKPWEARPRFEGVAPERFQSFDTPGYVKILFTIEARPVTAESCLAVTETRVVVTDPVSRKRFRRYWTLVLPGVRTIRRRLLGAVKAGAERRARLPR